MDSSGIPSVPAFVNPYKPSTDTPHRITPLDAPSILACPHPYNPNADSPDRANTAPQTDCPDRVTCPPSALALLGTTATRLTPATSAPALVRLPEVKPPLRGGRDLRDPFARRAPLHTPPVNGVHSSLVEPASPDRIASTKVPTPQTSITPQTLNPYPKP